jgi:hypothetical protein
LVHPPSDGGVRHVDARCRNALCARADGDVGRAGRDERGGGVRARRAAARRHQRRGRRRLRAPHPLLAQEQVSLTHTLSNNRARRWGTCATNAEAAAAFARLIHSSLKSKSVSPTHSVIIERGGGVRAPPTQRPPPPSRASSTPRSRASQSHPYT